MSEVLDCILDLRIQDTDGYRGVSQHLHQPTFLLQGPRETHPTKP